MTLYKNKTHTHTHTLNRWEDSRRKGYDKDCSACSLVLNPNVVQYHEDMDEVASGGIPHFQCQIVGRRYHCAVLAIPRYHGNLQLCHFVF